MPHERMVHGPWSMPTLDPHEARLRSSPVDRTEIAAGKTAESSSMFVGNWREFLVSTPGRICQSLDGHALPREVTRREEGDTRASRTSAFSRDHRPSFQDSTNPYLQIEC